MAEFAALTVRAKTAIESQDWAALADLMDANFACVSPRAGSSCAAALLTPGDPHTQAPPQAVRRRRRWARESAHDPHRPEARLGAGVAWRGMLFSHLSLINFALSLKKKAAKFPGSGGAIVGLLRNPAHARALQDELEAAGCVFVSVVPNHSPQ
jgi:hypothetical protein